MHPLLHDWTWRRQTREDMEKSWATTGSAFSIALHRNEMWYDYGKEYRSHLGTSVKAYRTYKLFSSADLPVLQILFCYAAALDEARDDSLALTCLDTIAEERFRKSGATEALHLGFMKLWARCRLRNGDAAGSVTLWNDILNAQASLAEDHPDRLASQHALAGAYQANGQVKEAVTLLQHVVKVHADVLAEDHPSRLTSQHELAGAYQANGQVKEAVTLLQHVVEVEGDVLAEDHPSRLASQHELAGAYQANGQVKEAVTLLQHVVKVKGDVLAEDHPSRLASQHALAGAYRAKGQIEQADELLEVLDRTWNASM